MGLHIMNKCLEPGGLSHLASVIQIEASILCLVLFFGCSMFYWQCYVFIIVCFFILHIFYIILLLFACTMKMNFYVHVEFCCV